MDCIRGCSTRLRTVLDILEIICFNLIHFAIDLSGIHIKGGDDGKSVTTYRKGELVWLGIANAFGFVAPIVLLVKVLGFRVPKCLLSGYYGAGCLSLLMISSVVTLTTYFQPEDSNCPTVLPADSKCVGRAENSIGFELIVLSFTLMNSVFYAYSLVLTWLKEETMTPIVDCDSVDESDSGECQV